MQCWWAHASFSSLQLCSPPKQIIEHCKRWGASVSEALEDSTHRVCCLPESLMHWPPTFDVPPFTVVSSFFRDESTARGSGCQCVLTEVASTIIPLFIRSFHHLKEGEEHIMKLFIITSYRYSYYLLFLKHLQSLLFLQNKRPNFMPITVFPFYFPNKFKRLEWWYCHTHNWILMSGDPLQQIRSLESRLKDKLCSSRSKIFPPIKRGASLDVYLTTSGNGVIAHPKLAPNLGLLALVYVFHQK